MKRRKGIMIWQHTTWGPFFYTCFYTLHAYEMDGIILIEP